MTIRFTLTLAVEGATADGNAITHATSTNIERSSLTAETIGLTLAESKAILAELQAAIVAEQVAAHEASARSCPACKTDRGNQGPSPAHLPHRLRHAPPHGHSAATMPM